MAIEIATSIRALGAVAFDPYRTAGQAAEIETALTFESKPNGRSDR